MELDEPDFEFIPIDDRRPVIPEPPPVRVVAVEDVTLSAAKDEVPALDAFYVGLLKFEREGDREPIYRAENVRLRFKLTDTRAEREDMRVLGIERPTLAGLEMQLAEGEFHFTRERGISAGELTLLLQDPAGNWVRIGQIQRIL